MNQISKALNAFKRENSTVWKEKTNMRSSLSYQLIWQNTNTPLTLTNITPKQAKRNFLTIFFLARLKISKLLYTITWNVVRERKNEHCIIRFDSVSHSKQYVERIFHKSGVFFDSSVLSSVQKADFRLLKRFLIKPIFFAIFPFCYWVSLR